MNDWSYDELDQWCELFKTGQNQSPINILVEEPLGATRATCWLRNKTRRTHLDSAGCLNDEFERSPSVSSNSSGTSSGAQEEENWRKNGSSERNSTELSTQRQNTRTCTTNKKIFLGYPRYLSHLILCNTGHGWQVNLPPALADCTLIAGVPFGKRHYRLAQLHCHWGESCSRGSEHQINGQSFAAEIHFVHWNCTDFDSFEEASRHKQGLAVLAVLVDAQEGEQYRNRQLDKIANNLKLIEEPGTSVTLQTTLDLKKLFPVNRWLYASYEGSLTTPPLSEVVDWIVFLEPIQASKSQIRLFRHLKCQSSNNNRLTRLVKNFRPVQPLGDRQVSIWTRQSTQSLDH